MKFFTLERYRRWYDEMIDDGEDLNIWADYKRHLEELRSRAPQNVLDLAKPFGVEDGLMVRVVHDREAKRLRLLMRCGDLIMGYYDLKITYEDAIISPEHHEALAEIARYVDGSRRHGTSLWRQELDFKDEKVIHGMCFHPGIWFEIRCDRLHFTRTPKPDRRIPNYKDRYPGGAG